MTNLAICHLFALLFSPLTPPVMPVNEFFDVTMILELNETDQDAEVVTTVESDDPLLLMAILGPKGLYAFLNLTDPDQLGSREVLLESAEPGVTEVLDAYPEGTYQFLALTTLGEVMSATVDFNHDLIEAPFFHPCDGEEVKAGKDLLIEWSERDGAESYVLELENEEAGIELRLVLPPDYTSFRVPGELLLPGAEYQLGVGVTTEDGNFSIAEASFFTKS